MLAGTINTEIIICDTVDDVELYKQKFIINTSIKDNEPVLLLALLYMELLKQLDDYILEKTEKLIKTRQKNKNING